ncbi:PorP/SprF family type IX secretion system membrane protein [Pedobacter metabolipauper]|nr:PorP/SprF family type IX secretion system membrane protein [Pedobacter metabolipauper]
MWNRILWIVLLFPGFTAMGQDHVYSQFFNAPIYLNPALTGQFEGDIRMNLIYRNQWSALSGDLSYISASADVNIPNFGGGVGLMFTRSSEGTAYLTKNNISANYAYSVGGEDLVVSFGIQAGVANRTIDWSKLVFSDQIDMNLGYIPGSISSAPAPEQSNRFYFDAGTGINVVYKNLMVGGTVAHVNKPDESFTGVQAKLPMRFIGNASYRINLIASDTYGSEDGPFLIPSVVYYKQAAASSLSMGAQFKWRGLNTGLWYRSNSQGDKDAIVVSFIFDIFKGSRNGEKLRLGISHDATTSKINYTNTSGSTEASIGYEKYFQNSSGYNKFNGLRCYDFY